MKRGVSLGNIGAFGPRSWNVQFEKLLAQDSSSIEGMREPEVRGEGVVGGCGDYAIFEDVAGGEAEDADGFDADVLIGGGVGYVGGWVGGGRGGGGSGVQGGVLSYVS